MAHLLCKNSILVWYYTMSCSSVKELGQAKCFHPYRHKKGTHPGITAGTGPEEKRRRT